MLNWSFLSFSSVEYFQVFDLWSKKDHGHFEVQTYMYIETFDWYLIIDSDLKVFISISVQWEFMSEKCVGKGTI